MSPTPWFNMVLQILFGFISIDFTDLFEVRKATATRGHPYKLFKPQCTISARSSFFTQRIINVWNDLPVNTTNFSSSNCFRNSLNCWAVKLPGPWLTLPLLFLLLLYFLPLYLVVVYYANVVFFFFLYSRAAVGVVFLPCCPVQVLSFCSLVHHLLCYLNK